MLIDNATSGKVLAIDINNNNLTKINEAINNFIPGYELITAMSGQEGIDIAGTEQPDTILINDALTDMDDYEVCKKLKEGETTKHIPIIIISEKKTDNESRIKDLSKGVDAFLTVPIDELELCCRLNLTLRIKKAEDNLRVEKELSKEKTIEQTTELIAVNHQMKANNQQLLASEETLINEKEFSEKIINTSSAIIVGIDKNRCIRIFNKGAEEITGYTSDEVKGKDWFSTFLSFDNIEEINEVWNNAWGISSHSYVNPIVCKTGEERMISWQTTGIYDGKDTTKHLLISIGEDITKQKKQEHKLLQAHNQLEMIITGANLGWWDWDIPSGDEIYNNKLAENLGYKLSEIKPNIDWWKNKIHPNDVESVNTDLQEHFAGKTEYYINKHRLKTKTGEWKWFVDHGKVVKWDVDGNPIRMVGTLRDIDKQEKAEQIQKVLFNISNAVVTTDSLEELIKQIQNELGTIIDTTNFYVALYNHETDSFSLPYIIDQKDKVESFPAGKTLTAYVVKTKKSLLATQKVMNRLEESGDVELIGTNSKVWLGVPLKTAGQVTGVLAIQSYGDENAFAKSDMKMLEFVSSQVSISIERKKKEKELKVALAKALESDRLKSSFLATMSHELRTPLNAIIGFSEIINEDMLMEDIVDYSKTINSSGCHLLSIIDNLFDITLIESEQVKIQNSKINLTSILKDIYDIIKTEQLSLKKEDIDLKLIIPQESEDFFIFTDITKFKQIFINILKNALKFTHEGKIRFGYNIELDLEKPIIKFYIKDTGIGIPDNKKKYIFDVFRQADESNTRKYGGSGIGLSISRKLTELLGGNIRLESEEGKGSVFYFTLPYNVIEKATQKATEKIAPKTKKVNNTQPKTILIVEDDVNSFELLKMLLGSTTKIIWAQDGKTAVEYCNDNPTIDLILMDINIPIMNGHEATREIKTFRPELPIIVQTAYAIAGDKEKALDAGGDDFITKPINKDLLMKMIDKWMG